MQHINTQLKEKIRFGLINIAKDSLRQAAKEYHQNLVGNIIYNIYNSPTSPYYTRTEGFLKSISQGFDLIIDADGGFELHLEDDRLLKASNGSRGQFGHHKSFPWDEPYPSNEEVKENLFDWLNDGFTILGKKTHPGYDFDIPEEEFWNKFIELFDEKAEHFILEVFKRGG